MKFAASATLTARDQPREAHGTPQARLAANIAQREIPCLNGLRGLAALSVVLFHGVSKYFPGPAAVSAFFVLSGFLITWLLAAEQERYGRVSISGFWKRRALRIFPAFYAFWIIQMLTFGASPGAAKSSLFYVYNYWQAFGAGLNGPFGHCWSLCVEEQFYLFWPLLFLRIRDARRGAAYLLSAAILIQAARFVLTGPLSYDYTYASFEMRCDGLFAGCALALYLRSGGRLPNWVFNTALAPVAVVLFVVAGWGTQPLFQSAKLGAAVATWTFGVLMVQAVAYKPAWLDNRSMRFLGAISYSLYLYHALAIHVSEAAGLRWRYTLPLGIVLSIAAATASHFTVERAALRFKRTSPGKAPAAGLALDRAHA